MENQTQTEVEEIEDSNEYYESAVDSYTDNSFDDMRFLPTSQDFLDAFSFW